MSEQQQPTFSREVRDTVVKSGLTGVAATVLAVTAFSPAGFGGVIGTSLASGLGIDHGAAGSDDPYARLAPMVAPLDATELDTIRGELARTSVSLEITRAATEGKIEFMRTIAEHQGLAAVAPMTQVAQAEPSFAPVDAVQAASAPAPRPAPAVITPVSYTIGEPIERDVHLELAQLLLAHENL